ncbi:hypothetical protein BHM03_00004995 [Ensete ventricosum]|nr:hypothetical protein BHM03_00004995 [Ensete ventricosum]
MRGSSSFSLPRLILVEINRQQSILAVPPGSRRSAYRSTGRPIRTTRYGALLLGLTMIGAMELQPDDGPRSSLSIRPGFKRCNGISLKFTRRFVEGIGKLAGNTPRDHRKKTKRLAARMSEVAGLAGGLVFTQRRSVVDAGVPQGGGLGSGRRPFGAKPL